MPMQAGKGLHWHYKKGIIYKNKWKELNRMERLLFHGSGVTVNTPEIRIGEYTKDFGYGFYCTDYYDQATRWAKRHNRMVNGVQEAPTVNVYVYTPNERLNILRFSRMTDEWLDFIAACRKGEAHSYDIVEGPMADDDIWNYVEDFLAGDISREEFWALAKFRYPTHQISFHTPAALECLVFERARCI